MATALYNQQVDEKRVVEVHKKKGDARKAYRRDVARLVHSPCFRRLQGKAQLFPSDENDFFRNRLTHSLEVAQIATGIALNLNSREKELKRSPIDIDLVHFAALAHDGVDRIVLSMMEELFRPSEGLFQRMRKTNMTNEELSYALSAEVSAASTMLQEEGHFRNEFTSKLVYAFMSNIEFSWNAKVPALSSVRLTIGTFQSIEVLKRFAYEALIMSNRFKVADRRGREIIRHIFKALTQPGGERLLPQDIRSTYEASAKKEWKLRTVCDFISSMTDRYCVEFYSRLIGINAPSIYKPY